MSDYLKVLVLRGLLAILSFLFVFVNKTYFIENFDLVQRPYVTYVFWTGICSLSIPSVAQYFATRKVLVSLLNLRWIIPTVVVLVVLSMGLFKENLTLIVPIGVLIEVCIGYFSGREFYTVANGVAIFRFIPWFLAMFQPEHMLLCLLLVESLVVMVLWAVMPVGNVKTVGLSDEILMWRNNLFPFISSYTFSKGMTYFASVLLGPSGFINFRLVITVISALGLVVSSYISVSVNRKLKGVFRIGLIKEFIYLTVFYILGYPVLYILNVVLRYIDTVEILHLLFGLSLSLRLLLSNHFYANNLNRFRFINDITLLLIFISILSFVEGVESSMWSYLSLGFLGIQVILILYAGAFKKISLFTKENIS